MGLTNTEQRALTTASRIPVVAYVPNFLIHRTVPRIAASALIFSAFGIWLMPNSAHEPVQMLTKLGFSVLFLFCAASILISGLERRQPSVRFDPVRREVRIFRHAGRGARHGVLRRSFDSFGRVEIEGSRVSIFERNGNVAIRLRINDLDVRRTLMRQFPGSCAGGRGPAD